MDGRDGRRVKLGDGRADPLEADLTVLAPDQGEHRIVGSVRSVECLGEFDQAGSDPVLQLGSRCPGKRDD